MHAEMKKKITLYLDTSVPSAYFDDTKPDRQKETKAFWDRLDQYHIYISDQVLKEINRTPDQSRRNQLLELVRPFELLPSETTEVKELAEEYLIRGAISIIEDAIHVAVAIVNRINTVASWNYQHLVKLRTKREVNAVNLVTGYDPIEIVDPSML